MEAVFQSFIKAFGWSILHSFWQGALIYTFLFLMLFFFRKLSPVIRHNLAYLSVCAIFIWFVATFILLWKIPVQNSGTDFPALNYENGFLLSAGWNISSIEVGFPALVAFYAAGFLIHSILLMRGFKIMQSLRKKELERVPSDWEHLFFRLMARLKVSAKVEMYISYKASVPMVIGFLKPVILFPASLVTSLDAEQVEAILVHELTHIKRHDYILNLIKTCIDTLLFFNPFVWLTGKIIRMEREHICDDMVLLHTGKPLKYAETLLQIELDKVNAVPNTVMGALDKKQYLLNRIKRITNMKTNYLNAKQQLAGLTIVIAAVFSLAWIKPEEFTGQEKKVKNIVATVSSLRTTPPAYVEKIFTGDTIVPPKKKSQMKIVVTDPDGKVQEYNSFKALPDSLKKNSDLFAGKKIFLYGDTIHGKKWIEANRGVFSDSVMQRRHKAIVRQFNSPHFKEKISLYLESINSPEFKKDLKDLTSKFSEKETQELLKKFNIDKFKNLQQESGKLERELKGLINSKELYNIQREALSRYNFSFSDGNPRIIMNGKDLSFLADSLSIGDKRSVIRIFNESRSLRDKELENNKQYQKLKRKFEKDVQKLRKKQAANAKGKS